MKLSWTKGNEEKSNSRVEEQKEEMKNVYIFVW